MHNRLTFIVTFTVSIKLQSKTHEPGKKTSLPLHCHQNRRTRTSLFVYVTTGLDKLHHVLGALFSQVNEYRDSNDLHLSVELSWCLEKFWLSVLVNYFPCTSILRWDPRRHRYVKYWSKLWKNDDHFFMYRFLLDPRGKFEGVLFLIAFLAMLHTDQTIDLLICLIWSSSSICPQLWLRNRWLFVCFYILDFIFGFYCSFGEKRKALRNVSSLKTATWFVFDSTKINWKQC